MEILKSYLHTRSVYEVHLSSFDLFVSEGLRNVIETETRNVIRADNKNCDFAFTNIVVERPTIVDDNRKIHYLTPREAKMRDISYDGTVYVDIRIQTSRDNVGQVCRYPFMKLPIMVGSKLCNTRYATLPTVSETDLKGYFIIRGKERVLVSQERMAYNVPLCLLKHGAVTVEMRSMSSATSHSALNKMLLCVKDFSLSATYVVPCVNQTIDMYQLLGMLDIGVDEFWAHVDRPVDQKNRVLLERFVRGYTLHLEAGAPHPTCTKGARTNIEIKRVVEEELFPHLGQYIKRGDCVIAVLDMFNRGFKTLIGARPPDSRDHYANKRIEVSGTLLKSLFKISFKRFARNIATSSNANISLANILSRYNNLTKCIQYSFSTGNWCAIRSTYVRAGVSQILGRISYTSALSYMKRVVQPCSKELKNSDVRSVHFSGNFFIDHCETPEGATVGLVKNFALTTEVTEEQNFTHVLMTLRRLVDGLGTERTAPGAIEAGTTVVTLNNRPVFALDDSPDAFLAVFRDWRTRKLVHPHTSVHMDGRRTISVLCDEGRMIRPLVDIGARQRLKDIMDRDRPRVVWEKTDDLFDELVAEGVIVYRTVCELENEVVAMVANDITDATRYMEIHPAALLGVMSSIVPFVETNQSPRVTYYSNMGKQAISWLYDSLEDACETTTHYLVNGQVPIVDSDVSSALYLDRMVSGNNAMVAVAPYMGFNQEDAIIISKSAIDKGMFYAYTMRTIAADDISLAQEKSVTIGVPPETYRKKHLDFSALDPDTGIVRIGTRLQVDTVLVGRYARVGDVITDKSVAFTTKDRFPVVHDTITFKTRKGNSCVKVIIRELRVPEVGDKFCSRSAQKSTIGLIVSHEDMPFTADGVIPDLILNPCALPSRMTLSQILEGAHSIAALTAGISRVNKTAWNGTENYVESAKEELVAAGYSSEGTCIMYDGTTGQKIETPIFMAPTFYHRLKHLVADKIYSRSVGSVKAITRQPLSGRSSNGALRLGEMELSCLSAHGASSMLVDKALECSDKYSMVICSVCGNIVNSQRDSCAICDTSQTVRIVIPYVFKLLMHNLAALGVTTKIFPKIRA